MEEQIIIDYENKRVWGVCKAKDIKNQMNKLKDMFEG